MTAPTIDLAAAQRLLLDDRDVVEVAASLGVNKRTLERAFVRDTGLTPAAWRRSQIGPRDRTSPPVFFRLPEYEALARVAEAAGVSPGEWARNAVRAALLAVKDKR